MASDFENGKDAAMAAGRAGIDVLNDQEEPGDVSVEKDPAPQTKICSMKDCVHGGKPQPMSEFDNNSTLSDGKQLHCKDCRRKMQRDARKKRKEAAVELVKNKTKKEGAPAPKPSHKICVDCRKPHPATPEYFGRHVRNPDGLQNMCRVCMGIRQKKSYRERYAVKDPHGGNGQKNIGSTKKNPSVKNSNVITVDFSGHHDLLQYLNEQAAASFRPVDMMVLSLINDHMKTHRE